MGNADCAVSRVHVLPTRALRAVRINPKILVLDLDLDVVVDLRVDPD